MAQTAIDGRNIYFSDTLVASSTTPSVVVRGHRYVSIPDDEIELFVYLWAFNGSTAPASTTTWTVGFVAVEDVVNTPVYFAGARPQGFAAPLPVVFPAAQAVTVSSGTITLSANTPTLAAGTNLAADFGVQYRASATGAGTLTNVNCPATPAAQQLKGTAGRLIGIVITNTSASDRWLKLFNATSASVTPGTTSALSEVGIKAGQAIRFTFEGGAAFSTAITIMITGGQGLTNNTAVTLGDVTGFAIFA
jgi:hypothetical protein